MKTNKKYIAYGVIFLFIINLVFMTGCVETSESPNKFPTASIDSVLPSKDSYILGENIEFTGTGADSDGYIVAWEWRSDIDGTLSNSANFATSSLSAGSHNIYFKVQDDKGNWSREERVPVVVLEESEDSVPIISLFTAGPEEISSGESSTLSWSVSDATSAEISPGIGTIELSGYRIVSPTETTLYTLTATNDAGSVNRTVLVTIVEEEPEEETEDTTPPGITSISPTGNDISVDTNIIITFSEAMDQTSAQAAFSTDPFTLGSFNWDGNQMTYNPSSNLSYSTIYTVTISTTAEDKSGNNMEESYIFTFIIENEPLNVLDLTAEASLDGTIWIHESDSTLIQTDKTSISIGDTASKYKGRGFLSYNFSDIPANAEIESATIYVYQSSSGSSIYGDDNFGVLLLEHLYYGDSLQEEDYDSLGTLIGTISDNADVEWKSIDVTSYFKNDLDDESRSHSQYRFRFSLKDTDGDSYADLASLSSADNSENKPYIHIEYSLT